MPILSIDDLTAAEEQGRIKFENRLPFSPFSLNLRLGKVFRRTIKGDRRMKVPRPFSDAGEMSQLEFIKNCLEPVNTDRSIVIGPRDNLYYQPIERVFLGKGLYGIVTSRSTYARLGLSSVHNDDQLDLRSINLDRWSNPLIALNSLGTIVELKPEEPIAQLFILDGHTTLPTPHLAEMVDTGKLILRLRRKKLRLDDVILDQGIRLHMDRTIKIYNGGLLRAGQDNTHCFTETRIPRGGVTLPQSTYFISSSVEHVEIPPGYIGYVKGTNSTNAHRAFVFPPEPFSFPQVQAHAHAPYIGPKTVFTGQITFENQMLMTATILPYLKQSELYLVSLSSPLTQSTHSRYNHQKGATLSKS